MIEKTTRRAAEREAHRRHEAQLIAAARYSVDEVAAAIIAIYPETAPHAETFARKLILTNMFRSDSAHTLSASLPAEEGTVRVH